MNKRQIVVSVSIAAILLAIVFISSGIAPGDEPDKVTEPAIAAGVTFAMDTVIEQKWYGEHGQETYDETEALLTALENQISLYKAGSEIDRINQNAGVSAVKVSEETFAMLKKAKELSLSSEGVFQLTIAPLSTLWGITGSSPKLPSGEEIEAAMALVGDEHIILDEAEQTVMLANKGMAIDMGAVAKGAACDLIRAIALENGVTDGYVSLGGNMMIIGGRPDKTNFVFGVRDPRGESNEYFATVELPELTMATTGDYERYFEQDGKRYHHILDPRTGYPADSDLISVSVISKDGALADFLSTTLFIYGKETVLQNLDRPEFDVIAVDKEKNVYVSNGIKDKVKPNKLKPEYTFERN